MLIYKVRDHIYVNVSHDCVDEFVDGTAFLNLSEDDVKTMVKPPGHVKLRLISSVESKMPDDIM